MGSREYVGVFIYRFPAFNVRVSLSDNLYSLYTNDHHY